MVCLKSQRHIYHPVKHLRGSIFAKIINGYKALTIFTKLHCRCLTWFYIRLCEHNFIFNIFWENIVYRKLIRFSKVLRKEN